jgi:hypothetical protein
MDEAMTSPMDAAQGAGTLVGRDEEHGRPYPHFAEKIGLVLTLVGAVFAGMWIWNESGWSNHWLWVSSICLLPILTLFISEAIGRMINTIHANKE